MSWANFNLLPQVLSLIPPTKVEYRTSKPPEVDEYGQAVNGYSGWTEAYGIVQPGGMRNAHMGGGGGLDNAPRTAQAWLVGVDLRCTNEKQLPDQIRCDGKIYNVTGVDDWLAYDNFRHYTLQEVLNQ